MIEKKYEIDKDAPNPISWNEYERKTLNIYYELLASNPDKEDVFQNFFEMHPSFLPGAFELGSNSGHYPYMNTVITQPKLGASITRNPDFLWLANDSLTFCPVFIEIEKPSKKMFNVNGTTSADFNQALEQIHEWQYLLQDIANRAAFYDYYDIPLHEQKKTFRPQYLLIYGRRSEYENDRFLTGKRAQQLKDNFSLMSYDRLRPFYDCQQFITCKVHNQKYNVVSISPTFRYRADCAEDLLKMVSFYDQIDSMESEYTSIERKEFLKKRYQYWIAFGKKEHKGMIVSSEGE